MTPTQLVAALQGGIRLHLPEEATDPALVRLADITHDSAQAGPGVLFACRPGQRHDGHTFAPEVVAAGSPALLCERTLPVIVPQILVRSVAEAMGPAAAAVHGHPSRDLRLIGVTGTSGKTTTTYLVESALRAASHVTGLIGTVTTLVAGREVQGVRTTPEATDLQRLLRDMVTSGVTGAAMEVSSHGLALGRVRGTRFAVAVFTNLGQDHLDFHRDFEDYFAAKARLFTPEFTPIAVVNVDDPWGRRLAASISPAVRVVRVGVGVADADITASDVASGPDGSAFTVTCGERRLRTRIQMPGLFNVANAVCALAAVVSAGVDLNTAASGIAEVQGVPGRMERIDAGQPFAVLVDYAHKPDALTNVLAAARELTRSQVIVVVGCGGDRDRAKRPVMGRAAAKLADLAVFTSDNPRSEDPLAILDAMVRGARGVPGAHWTVEADRRAAIALALLQARPGDVVVIAGKGHEPYQEVGDRLSPFDDRLVAGELLRRSEGVRP
ncbi:MAG: UDP-N-acetylmuramoyl-L-alanyl-D-glutamate--2,6-diaminopimelate ligase [Egibacteraceae bacterium]